MSCFVKDCKNIRRLIPPTSKISFHRFPRDVDLFHQWLQIINREEENISWSKYMFICSEHFVKEDFEEIDTSTLKHVLKKGAIPSINIKKKEAAIVLQQPTTSGKLQVSYQPKQTFIVPIRSPQSSPRQKKRTLSSSTDTASETTEIESVIDVENPAYKKSGWISSSSDSSLERKRKQLRVDHPYWTSPGTSKVKYQEIKTKYVNQTKKLYKVKESIRNLKKQVCSLKQVVNALRDKNALSTSAMEHLDKTYGDIPVALMSRMIKLVRSGSLPKTKFPESLRKFAITLNFYSCKSYEYVRKVFNLALPHPSVIRKWSTSIECEPGFCSVCLDALKIKVDESKLLQKKVVCSLLLDEMSIKKKIDFDGKRNWGYVDVGVDLQNDQVIPASEAFVLMVVSINASWKLPIAYFLIRSLTGSEKANIVREALIRLRDIDVEVTSVTCDGPTAHFTMFKELGCDFKRMEEVKTYFQHPSYTEKEVYAVFDICHMLKLLRNCFSELELIIDPEGEKIKWEFLKKLHNIQENEIFFLANKLKKSHIDWKTQKMKVGLAAQTLSSSVAEALNFLCTDLKHPDFQGCEATIKFIRIIDKLFDVLNSRLPWATGFKGPLKEENEGVWRPFLAECIYYLLHLKDVGGRFLWTTPKRTPFMGFVISIKSVIGIFEDYVKTKIISYFLTYKISQDHLELFFCAVRSRNGWNNNPSALQFMRSFRKLILHTDLSGSGGNCRVLDTTPIITVSSGTKKDPVINEIDILSVKKNSIDFEEILKEHNYDMLPKLINLTEYSENVVTYISGYVVKMMRRTVICEECLELLTTTYILDQNFAFIKRKDRGGFIYPSKGIVTICTETEMYIRKIMYLTEYSLPSQDLIVDIIFYVSRKLINKLCILFPLHEEHRFNLMKSTIHCYCKIRLHNLAKKYTENIQGNLVRKKFSKLILFHHQ